MTIKNSKSFKLLIILSITLIVAISSIFGISSVLGNDTNTYKIVISASADGVEKGAANELQFFLQKATGKRYSIIKDNQTVDGGKYISVGNTTLAESKGVIAELESENLKDSGYMVKTIDDTIYLLGPTSNGTLYSVYGYLNKAYNFEYYFTDVYTLDTDKTDVVKVDEFTVNPDINNSITPNVGFVQANSTNRQRFNVLTTNDLFIPANGTTECHNLGAIFNNIKFDPSYVGATVDTTDSWETEKLKYVNFRDAHPTWISENGLTACFTARGNSSDYEEMQEHFLDVIKKGLKTSSANYFMISQTDNGGFCTCETCWGKIASSMYGYTNNSGTMITFCNDLADKVYAWFADKSEEGGRDYARDFKIYMMAYQQTSAPPVKKSVLATLPKCNEHVGVYLAFDNYYSSYESNMDKENKEETTNKDIVEYINEWKNFTNHIGFWLYDVNFGCTTVANSGGELYPYDTSAYKQEFYQLMKDVGAEFVSDQSQPNNLVNAVAWANYKNYISSKLRWNVNANVGELTQNFFDACYKDASEIMLNVYNEQLAHWAYLRATYTSDSDKTALGSIFGNLTQTKYWSETLLNSWVSQIEDAFDAIETLKTTDKATYDKIYSMICAEIISPMTMLIEMYGYGNNAQFVSQYKQYMTDAQMASDFTSNWYDRLGI